MIRDANKIYGEKNDPNTVTADGTLSNGALMLGAGNKKIKEFVMLGKGLLYTDGSKVLKSFPYGTPNKAIGTDANGNLALLDMAQPVQRYVWGKQVVVWDVLFESTAGSNISAGTIRTFQTGAIAISVNKTGSVATLYHIDITFGMPLNVNDLGIAGKKGYIVTSAACPFIAFEQIHWYCKNSSGNILTDRIVMTTPTITNQGISYSGEVTIPSNPIYGFRLYPKSSSPWNQLPATINEQALNFAATLEWEG